MASCVLTHPPFEVPESTTGLWQDVVDLMAETLMVPAGLIMRINHEDIEVFVASRSQGNPYHPGEREPLLASGLYCERVLRTRERLIVPCALEDDEWKDNPDIERGMIFYMGYPIRAPNGMLFGTICVLDRKKTTPSETYQNLVLKFRDMIESDLLILTQNRELHEKNMELEKATTETTLVKAALETKSAFLDKVIETSALSTWISDKTGTVLRANPACLSFFGATEEEVVGKYNLFKDVVIERHGFMPTIRRVFDEGVPASIIIDYDFAAVNHVQVKNATHKIINSIFTPIMDNRGYVTNVIVQSIDLTELKNTESDLRERVKELNCLYRISDLVGNPDASIEEILKETVKIIPPSFIYPDETYARIFYEGKEFKSGDLNISEWKQTSNIFVYGSRVGSIEVYCSRENHSKDGPFVKEEEDLVNAVAERLGKCIEYQKAQEELKYKNAQLEQLAVHDPLTGLPNRVLFRDRIGQGVALSKRNGLKIAVCVADVDDFKDVNDSFGHLNGDQVLKEIATRAKSALREQDTISRFGGDEFTILLLGIQETYQAEMIIKRMMEVVNQPIAIGAHVLRPSLSVGVALCPDDGMTPDELIGKADKAMYRCKRMGKNRWGF